MKSRRPSTTGRKTGGKKFTSGRGRRDEGFFTSPGAQGKSPGRPFKKSPGKSKRDFSKGPEWRKEKGAFSPRDTGESRPFRNTRKMDDGAPSYGRKRSFPRSEERSERPPRREYSRGEGSRDRFPKRDGSSKPFGPRRDEERGEGRPPYDRDRGKPFGTRRREDDRSERRPSYDRDRKKSFGARRDDSRRSEGSGRDGGRKPYGSTWKRDDRPGEERRWNRKEKHTFYGEKKSKPPVRKTESAEEDGLTRLNKFIANAGVCSRREADEMIAAGVITVNGEVITEMGYKVKPGDEVRYNNETLKSEKMVYLLLNKPKDFITTSDDPENRKTVMSLIENACRERVYPVGRLDRNTSGLLLFTNDGELARRLTHPSFEVQKIYQVDLDKNLKPGDMEQITSGIQLDDGFIKPDAISYVGSGSDKSIVGIELHSGRNRIVRRIFEHFEYKVKKLDRVYFAGLSKKDLPRGRWRFLTSMEVAGLKMLTGDKKFKDLPAKPGAVSVD